MSNNTAFLLFFLFVVGILTVVLLLPVANVQGAPVPIQCISSPCMGTNGDDNMVGTSKNDKMFGLDGNDILRGLGGNDLMTGAKGNDVIGGGDGADQMYGLAGNDRILGGVGKDYINGTEGDDVLYARDSIVFSDGVGDMIVCGLGNDRVYIAPAEGDQVTKDCETIIKP